MGAPVGNTNSADGQRYRKALERALAHKHGSVDDGLFALAQTRVAKALDGDNDAAKEIGDRIDGRPSQALSLGSDPDKPVIHKIVREIVRTPHTDG